MADLLSNRADAYARFYFRVRALRGVVQRPVSVHLFFFSPQHRRAARDVLFLRRQSRTRPGRGGPSSRLQPQHADCIFIRVVDIVAEYVERLRGCGGWWRTFQDTPEFQRPKIRRTRLRNSELEWFMNRSNFIAASLYSSSRTEPKKMEGVRRFWSAGGKVACVEDPLASK